MAVCIPTRWLLVVMTVSLVLNGMNCQESTLFQCQSSSDQSGLVYTPNIPDFYFNDENAANSIRGGDANLIETEVDLTYIFTIPSESHDCSGTVRSIQYCYRARNRNINDLVSVFNFLVLSQDGLQFTVQNNAAIQATPQDSICTDPNNQQIICCDTTPLSTNLQISISSDFTFGVVVIDNAVRPLAFRESATQFNVEQYQDGLGSSQPPGNMFMLEENNKVDDESLLLLRFMIESAPTESDSAQTESESAQTESESAQTESELASESASEFVQIESETGLPTTDISTSTTTKVADNFPVRGVTGGAVVIILIITLLIITVCIAMIMKHRQKLKAEEVKEPIDASPKEDMTLQGNAANISTSPISLTTNESYATTASTVPDHTHNSDEPYYISIDGGGVRLDVKMQGNEAYSTSRPITVEYNEAYATTVTNPQSYLEEEDYI